MAAASLGSGSSWFDFSALKMSAVACRERDQMMRNRGKCSASRASLLPSECACSTTGCNMAAALICILSQPFCVHCNSLVSEIQGGIYISANRLLQHF